ncbi:glutamate 5-kinase [Auricularia subglabra TFB-10046 SS5]|nr:glutamate 5-kinase [Auricularia subglabra TFB-10046 SS5]
MASARKASKTLPLTIVIKLGGFWLLALRPAVAKACIGTSSIVHERTHKPLLTTLSSVVECVAELRAQGHRVVLVSSGAIGVGLQRMDLPSRPKQLAKKQALAAIGQGRLIALWDNLFSQLGQPIAQILITRGDIADRTRYLNAVNTLNELLSMDVVPIVNENDTVSVSEIKFGDNDTLSAITSSMIKADYLFLLTDVDCLYTTNPRTDPSARPIEVVSSVSDIRLEVSTKTLGSKLGTGGMETKLIAAEIATGAGVATVILSSQNVNKLQNIIDYNTHILHPNASSSPTPPPDERPPHTLFTPSAAPLPDLKLWTAHTLTPAGAIVIDPGAHAVLARRESGGRLLPAGVRAVRGDFASGQAVRILVHRNPNAAAASVASALLADSNPASGARTPDTPALGPVNLGSLANSVSTLDPTSRQGSFGTLEHALTMTPTPVSRAEEDDLDEADLLEVGRGLANFNSHDIARVKGQKSSAIVQILGYADSEHVVENITIRIPPSLVH